MIMVSLFCARQIGVWAGPRINSTIRSPAHENTNAPDHRLALRSKWADGASVGFAARIVAGSAARAARSMGCLERVRQRRTIAPRFGSIAATFGANPFFRLAGTREDHAGKSMPAVRTGYLIDRHDKTITQNPLIKAISGRRERIRRRLFSRVLHAPVRCRPPARVICRLRCSVAAKSVRSRS